MDFDSLDKKKLITLLKKADKKLDRLKTENKDLKKSEKDLKKSEAMFRDIVNNVLEYIYSVEYKNGKTISTFHSPRCHDVTGYTITDYLENPHLWMDMVHRKDLERVIKFAEEVKDENAPKYIEHRVVSKEGEIKWVSNTSSIQFDEDGNIIRETGFILDITRRKSAEDEREKLIIIDPLTEIFNHRFIIEKLPLKIAEAKRYKNPLSIIMFDLDFFKKINDIYGHQVGDHVLTKISKVVKQVIREVDIPVRYGGEEFLILLPNTNFRGALKTAEKIRSTIEELTWVHSGLKVTVSIGVSSLGDEDSEELISKTDKLLYKAKKNGRNRIEYKFSEE